MKTILVNILVLEFKTNLYKIYRNYIRWNIRVYVLDLVSFVVIKLQNFVHLSEI